MKPRTERYVRESGGIDNAAHRLLDESIEAQRAYRIGAMAFGTAAVGCILFGSVLGFALFCFVTVFLIALLVWNRGTIDKARRACEAVDRD